MMTSSVNVPQLDYRRYFSDLVSGVIFILIALYILLSYSKMIFSDTKFVGISNVLGIVLEKLITYKLFIFYLAVFCLIISPAVGAIVNATSFLLLDWIIQSFQNRVLSTPYNNSKIYNLLFISLKEYKSDERTISHIRSKFKLDSLKTSNLRTAKKYLNMCCPELMQKIDRYTGIGIFFRNLSFCSLLLAVYFSICLLHRLLFKGNIDIFIFQVAFAFTLLSIFFIILSTMAFLTDNFEICHCVYVYDNFFQKK